MKNGNNSIFAWNIAINYDIIGIIGIIDNVGDNGSVGERKMDNG